MKNNEEIPRSKMELAFEYARVKEQRIAVSHGLISLNAVSSAASTAGIGPDVYEQIREIRKAFESADDNLFNEEQELYHQLTKLDE